MPALEKPSYERFAQAIALGMPASQAYKQHVSGGKCSDRTAEVNGSSLALSTEVALRIEELRGKVAEKAESKFALTRDKWLEKLGEIARDAHDSGDFSAATGALKEVGKAADFYAPAKVEVSGSVTILSDAVKKVFGA